jgi:hypothetical protein
MAACSAASQCSTEDRTYILACRREMHPDIDFSGFTPPRLFSISLPRLPMRRSELVSAGVYMIQKRRVKCQPI